MEIIVLAKRKAENIEEVISRPFVPSEVCSRGIARHCAALRGNFVARSLLPCPPFPGISHHFPALFFGGGATEQVFKRRCLQIPSPSGLLPLRLTPTQPMLRKGNFYRA